LSRKDQEVALVGKQLEQQGALCEALKQRNEALEASNSQLAASAQVRAPTCLIIITIATTTLLGGTTPCRHRHTR
jgi:hypothetical protein